MPSSYQNTSEGIMRRLMSSMRDINVVSTFISRVCFLGTTVFAMKYFNKPGSRRLTTSKITGTATSLPPGLCEFRTILRWIISGKVQRKISKTCLWIPGGIIFRVMRLLRGSYLSRRCGSHWIFVFPSFHRIRGRSFCSGRMILPLGKFPKFRSVLSIQPLQGCNMPLRALGCV